MNPMHDNNETRLLKEIENAMNRSSFSYKAFASAIPSMHPTMQQALYRLIRECLTVMADDNRRYDDRNRASHEEARAILEYLKENGKHIPFL